MGYFGQSRTFVMILLVSRFSDIYIPYHKQVDEILKSTTATPSRPSKTISSAFEPHMGVFVDAQDKWVLISICRLSHYLNSHI